MKDKNLSCLTKGIIRENPVLTMLLGLCPVLGVSTTAAGSLSMGLTTLLVLVCSAASVSFLKNIIPPRLRLLCFLIIISAFVSTADILISAYLPRLHKTLGIYLPLIVVNGIILNRTELFAAQNNLKSAVLDALGMGTGFTLIITVLGIFREIAGAGTLFGFRLLPDSALILLLPPGAFFALACLFIVFNRLRKVC